MRSLIYNKMLEIGKGWRFLLYVFFSKRANSILCLDTMPIIARYRINVLLFQTSTWCSMPRSILSLYSRCCTVARLEMDRSRNPTLYDGIMMKLKTRAVHRATVRRIKKKRQANIRARKPFACNVRIMRSEWLRNEIYPDCSVCSD